LLSLFFPCSDYPALLRLSSRRLGKKIHLPLRGFLDRHRLRGHTPNHAISLRVFAKNLPPFETQTGGPDPVALGTSLRFP
jgi:hypothetical protein